MRLEMKGKILSAESKPYSIAGNEGVSHKVRALVGDEIFSLKATESLVGEAQAHLEAKKEVVLHVDLTSPKENVRLTLARIG